MMRTLLRAALLVLALALPRPVAAQERLEGFAARVARLWSDGNARALADLAPEGGHIVLALGADEARAVHERHVGAALRDLFNGRETVSVRTTQVTLSGGTPALGFSQLSWVSRPSGVTRPVTATVYLGAVLEDGVWRLREIRVLS
jgi:hypothetical protein